MNEELRCYTFTLSQLNTMQQGIQAAHAIVELGMNAYLQMVRGGRNDNFDLYYSWAADHKTMVFLNGGDSNELHELEVIMFDSNNTFPWARFYEDGSLRNILTSIAIILPERIFKTAEMLRKKLAPVEYPMRFNDWELQLIDRLVDARRAT